MKNLLPQKIHKNNDKKSSTSSSSSEKNDDFFDASNPKPSTLLTNSQCDNNDDCEPLIEDSNDDNDNNLKDEQTLNLLQPQIIEDINKNEAAPKNDTKPKIILNKNNSYKTPDNSSDSIHEPSLDDQEFLTQPTTGKDSQNSSTPTKYFNETRIKMVPCTVENMKKEINFLDTLIEKFNNKQENDTSTPFRSTTYKTDSIQKEEKDEAEKIKQLKAKMIETLDPKNNNRPGAIKFYVRPFLNSNYNSVNNLSVFQSPLISTSSIKKVNGFEEITSETMDDHLKYETSYVSVEIFKDQPDYQALEEYLTKNKNACVVAHYTDTTTGGEIYCRILSTTEFTKHENIDKMFDNMLGSNNKKKPSVDTTNTDSTEDQKVSKKSYFKTLIGVGGAMAVFIFVAHYFNLLPDIMMTNLHALFNKLQTLPTSFFAR